MLKKIDDERPENGPIKLESYPIKEGMTSSSDKMKRGAELRIYFDTTENIPESLRKNLQNDNKKRVTGNFFVEACIQLGFKIGTKKINK